MSGDEVFTIQARRCKRCGRLLTSQEAVERGYGCQCAIKAKREENYHLLTELLPSESIFNQVIPEGPFAYPYYHEDGLALRKWLAGRKIFVPTYWRNIIDHFDEDTMEYDWAANVLPLPCDQRYGEEEMRYIADSIREWEETKA